MACLTGTRGTHPDLVGERTSTDASHKTDRAGSRSQSEEGVMAVTDDEVLELIEELDRGRDRWIHGRTEEFLLGAQVNQSDDMTIFGPFGGPGPRPGEMSPEELLAGQAAVSSQFGGGSGSVEVVKTIVEGDLVVVVAVEHNEVMFSGRDILHPWTLRTTQVFRRTNDRWLRLHRHADPLILHRSLDETLSLFDEA
jgi:ketosteroid isomerase-like protein